MRFVQILAAVLFVVLGAVFSALNPVVVPVDLYFVQLELTLGVLMILALLLGALLGGLALVFGVVLPLRRRLRQTRKPPGTVSPVVADTPIPRV